VGGRALQGPGCCTRLLVATPRPGAVVWGEPKARPHRPHERPPRQRPVMRPRWWAWAGSVCVCGGGGCRHVRQGPGCCTRLMVATQSTGAVSSPPAQLPATVHRRGQRRSPSRPSPPRRAVEAESRPRRPNPRPTRDAHELHVRRGVSSVSRSAGPPLRAAPVVMLSPHLFLAASPPVQPPPPARTPLHTYPSQLTRLCCLVRTR
jgi:hypothetical protein